MAEKGATGVKITFGGWYQRTTLHLTEIYEFLSKGRSRLSGLDPAILKEMQFRLDLKLVTRETGYLDYVYAVTKSGIQIRYYEDGLYIFEIESDNVENSVNMIRKYYDDVFNPAINYIFSLGAPTPKILSNIKDDHPLVISLLQREHSLYNIPSSFGEVYNKTSSKDISVYKTPGYIFVVGMPNKKDSIDLIIQMEIFFREFKDQLQKYLNIHRKVWEEISDIKERKYVKGREVDDYRAKLETYKKSIDLIANRINQMPAYAHTRASIAKKLNVEKQLVELFQYKFEDLFNTFAYIKEIWAMTANYVNSAIAVLVEIGNKTAVSGIRSIQVLASVGVVTTVVGYLTRDTLPQFSKVGLYYMLGLVAAVLVLDTIMKVYARSKRYELKFTETDREI